jgi:hypothetical protein
MKNSFLLLFVISIFVSCTHKKTASTHGKTNNLITRKAECYISPNESFDSTFVINGEPNRLQCITECFGDYIVNDTINDSTIVLYRNRIFNFKLKNNEIDTQLVVTKDLIKEPYGVNSTFRNSVISFPKINAIDSENNSILMSLYFLYPIGLEGTDFFETIIFEITLKGKVNFKKIIPYEEPGV